MKSGGSDTKIKNNPVNRNTLDLIDIPPGLKEAFASLRPVNEEQANQWAKINNELINSANEEDLKRLVKLNELIGPLSAGPASLLIWQNIKIRPTPQTFIVVDARNRMRAISNDILLSWFNDVIDLRNARTKKIGENSGFTVYEYGDSRFTIIKEINFSSTDNSVLLRSVLDHLGFYKNNALFISKIRLLGASADAGGTHFGFKTKTLSPEKWITVGRLSLLAVESVYSRKRPTHKLSPQAAMRALANLTNIAETLKHAGLAMDSWSNLMVNVETGEISLGDFDRPVLVNSSLLSQTLISGAKPYYQDRERHLPYIPNFSFLALGNMQWSNAERQLIDIMIYLRRMSGQTSFKPSNEALLNQVIEEFDLFVYSADDRYLTTVFSENRSTISAIIEQYLSNFEIEPYTPDFKGILNFMTQILPAIMITSKPGDWFTTSYWHIEKARQVHLAGERNMESYWAKVGDELWNKIREQRNKQKKSGGGIAQTPGSDNDPEGSGGTPIAQAKGTSEMQEPIGWVASSVQMPLPAQVPAVLPAAQTPLTVQGGFILFTMPPSNLIH
jgi:hypothetical protein